MQDNYTHGDDSVIYIVQNILGPTDHSSEYKNLMDKFNSQLIHYCNCKQSCISNSCTCLQLSGGINYTSNVENGQTKFKLDYKMKNLATPIIECNNLCSCSDSCGNRLVQKGPCDNLFIKTCDIKSKGRGIFTKQFISEGTFICEYAGELITKSEALKRNESNALLGNMNFLFCLNEHSNGCITQTIVDPTYFGNIARYINHSCDPNCQIFPVRVNTPIPKLAIFSSVDILPNTEITFHYGTHHFGEMFEKDFINRKRCLCGSNKCVGCMPYDVY